MQIKRFEAKDMTQALRMVKKEFGDDAVILSAKTLTRPSRILGAIKKSGVVITAATDQAVKSSKTLNRLLKESRKNISPSVKEPLVTGDEKKSIFKPLYENLSRPFLKKEKEPNALIPEDQTLKKKAAEQNGNPKMTAYVEALIRYHRIAPSIAMDLIADIKGADGLKDITHPDQMKPYLIGALKKRMVTVPYQTDFSGRKIISFVGGFGSGKTTALVKLAAHHRTLMNRKVAVISLDHYRVGNTMVLKSYAEILGVGALFVSSREELEHALDTLHSMDLILIDTPGIALDNVKEIQSASTLLASAKSDETHLVLNVSVKNDDLEKSIRVYRAFSPTHLIFTRLDESVTFGNMINHVIQSKLPLSYISNGVNIPEDIKPVTFELIGDLIFRNGLPGKKPAAKEKAKSMPAEPVKVVKETEEVADEKPATGYDAGNESALDYIANKNSDIFHHRTCQSVKRIHPANITYFKDMDEALEKRFKPCRMCCHVKVSQKFSNQPIRQKVRSRRY